MKRVLLNVATVMCFVLTSCGMLTLASCNKENGVVPDYEKPVVISCVKPDYLQQVNTADITALKTPAAVRLLMAGKREQ